MRAELHNDLFRAGVGGVLLDRVEHRRKLVAEEDGHDGRRGFVRAETVVVARRRNGETEQILIIVHRLYDGYEEQQELSVLMGRFAWREKVHPGIGSYGPVVVFSASVYPGEGFFVQQAYQAMLGGHLLHYFHGKLVMVGCDICGGIYRRKLVL